MCNQLRNFTVFAVFFAGFCANSFAQDDTVRYSPLRFSLSVGAEVTDNRDSLPNAESNTDIYFKPRLEGTALPGGMTLSYYYQPSLRYRSDPSDIQNESEMLHDLGFEVEANPTGRQTLKLREWFIYTDDPAVTDEGAELRRDSSYMRNKLYGEWNLKVSRLVQSGFSGSYMTKFYSEDAVADFSDEDNISVDYWLKRRMARNMAISGVIRYDQYERKPFSEVERSFYTVTYLGVIDQRLGSNLRIEGKAGVQTADYDAEDIDSASSPYFNLAAIINLNPDTLLTVEANRSIWNGYTFPFSSQQHTHFNASLEWKTGPRWIINLFGEYRIEEYESDTVHPDVSDDLFIKDRG